jgi:hypothetical protein
MEFRSTLKRAGGLAVVAAVVGGGLWLTSDASAMGKGATKTYEVSVTNLTRGQVLSPPFVVAHTGDMEPLWQNGQPASSGLAAIAEDADTSVLAAALEGADGVLSTTPGGGPIPPGITGTVTIEVRGKRSLVSLVSMLVQTNDAFVGARGLELPRSNQGGVARRPHALAGLRRRQRGEQRGRRLHPGASVRQRRCP